jgi:hypothetical protein
MIGLPANEKRLNASNSTTQSGKLLMLFPFTNTFHKPGMCASCDGSWVRKLLHRSSVTRDVGVMQGGKSLREFWLKLRVRRRGSKTGWRSSQRLHVMEDIPQLRSKISSREGGSSSACSVSSMHGYCSSIA